ncbi:hypothetical protein [Treponema sp. R80B11-R83G3]
MTSEQRRLNAEKSFTIASALFPSEEWIPKENNIWVAKSRLIEEYKEPMKWEREMSQVRILTDKGSVAVFLPEKFTEGEAGLRCADTVIDGEIVELKTVTGTRATLSKDFKKGYKQGASLIKNHANIQSHSVFIRLFSDLSVESVKAKIAGELKMRYDEGNFICFFEISAELYQWKYSELRAMINKKSPGLV